MAGCTLLLADEADKKQCTRDSDCEMLDPSLPLQCRNDICVDISQNQDASRADGKACTLDPQCGEGLVCGDDFVCVECREDKDCKGADKRCLTARNDCVECVSDENCESGEKCGDDNVCYDPVWGCAPTGDAVSSKPPDWPQMAKSSFQYKIAFANLLEVLGIGEVKAYACEAISAQECNEELALAKGKIVDNGGPGSPATSGGLTVDFKGVGANGFVGYVLIESTEAQPAYFHFVDPIVEDTAAQDRLLLIAKGTITGIGAMANIKFDPDDPTRTMLIVLVYDCEGKSVANVQMEVDKSPDQGFVAVENEKTPVFNTKTTTADGVGILINVGTGFHTITLRNGVDGPVLRELSVNLRGNAINYMHVYPSYEAVRMAQERISAAKD
jgi:hypothetical protein